MAVSILGRVIAPGPLFLARDILPFFLLLAATAIAVLRLFSQYTAIYVPGWIYATAIAASYPLYGYFTLLRLHITSLREMRAKGAIALPQIAVGSRAIIDRIATSFSKGYPGDVFWEWALQYGNAYVMDIYSEKRVMTLEPEHIKAILVTQFNEFEKAPLLLSQMADLLGTGVFNADGDMWKFHRNMTRPFFSKDRISDFENFERHITTSVALAKARLAEGQPIDIQDLICRFTLDSTSEYLFGQDVESLSAGLPYPPSSNTSNSPQYENHPSNVFVRAFMTAQEYAGQRSRYGKYWAFKEFWSNKVVPLRKIVDGYIEPIVREALAKEASGKFNEKDNEENLLATLVRETEDVEAINDQVLNILVAARDTTASLIVFVIYALCRNPKVAEKLREEIATVIGKRAPTYADIRELKYLRAVINETLRLYTPVPFDSRTSNVSTTLPNKTGKPYYIAKGTKVLYSIFLMQRRTDLWGPTALEFDPDRFLDDRHRTYVLRNPFIFLPFNAGPRICLGQQFAYNEASYCLIRLLQTFSSIGIAEDAQVPESRPPAGWFGPGEEIPGSTRHKDTIMFGMHLTMYARGGLWVRMTKEDSELDSV